MYTVHTLHVYYVNWNIILHMAVGSSEVKCTKRLRNYKV